MVAIHNKRFQCFSCVGADKSNAAHLEVRKKLHCDKKTNIPIYKLDSLNFYKCLGNYYNESVLYWMKAQRLFESGIMPFSGSLFEQPNKAIEIFDLILDHNNKIQEQQMKQAKKNG